MKNVTILIIWLILAILLCTCRVKAEENYWQVLKQLMMEKTPEAGMKGREYINSLSISELIITGRQCSEEIEKKCPDTVFCQEGFPALIFFFFTYAQKDGLKNITPLIQEIEDRAQTNHWRASLISFLGDNDWLESMKTEQLYPVMDRMLVVISDKTEHYRLRYEASGTARGALEQLEKNNLLAEPVIQKKVESGSLLRDLKKEVIDGKITLSDSYKQAHAKTMKYCNSYAQTLLPVLNEPQLKPILLRGVLKSLTNSLGRKSDSVCLGQKTDSDAQVRKALEDAVRNYNKFNEEQWQHLAIIGTETLNLPDMNDILPSMVKEMDKIIAGQQDAIKKLNLESDREFINGKLLGNLSEKQRNGLIHNISSTEKSLEEAKKNVATPRSEEDRLYWEARVKRCEGLLKELKEILRRGKVKYLMEGIPELRPDYSELK